MSDKLTKAAASAFGKLGGNSLKKQKAKSDPDYYKRLARKGAEARWGKKKESK